MDLLHLCVSVNYGSEAAVGLWSCQVNLMRPLLMLLITSVFDKLKLLL